MVEDSDALTKKCFLWNLPNCIRAFKKYKADFNRTEKSKISLDFHFKTIFFLDEDKNYFEMIKKF